MLFFSKARDYRAIHKTALRFALPHWSSRWPQRPSFSSFALLRFADEMLFGEAGMKPCIRQTLRKGWA